jgi:hypothetical protein
MLEVSIPEQDATGGFGHRYFVTAQKYQTTTGIESELLRGKRQ